jgi:hypothetical protein
VIHEVRRALFTQRSGRSEVAAARAGTTAGAHAAGAHAAGADLATHALELLAGGQLLRVTHPLTEWRGTLDWWVFTDGQLGQASVIINGYPGEAWPTSGIQGAMEAKLTALDRTLEHVVTPP